MAYYNKRLNIKKRNIAILGWSVILISCIGEGNRNYSNLQKKEIRMSISEVENIMGDPDSVLIALYRQDEFSYMYAPPFGASGNLYINFSMEDSTVVSIYNGH